MLRLTVTITGESTEDLVAALKEVLGCVERRCTSGYFVGGCAYDHGQPTASSFKFSITEDDQ